MHQHLASTESILREVREAFVWICKKSPTSSAMENAGISKMEHSTQGGLFLPEVYVCA